nr:MAG TPA: zinc-ribbon containing domain protein [Caudoviricetes sp.]
MADYISREAAIAYIREQSEELQKAFEELGGESGIYADAYNDLAEDFHRIPAADVEPVRHGRWEVYTHSRYCGNDEYGDPVFMDGVVYYCSNPKCRRKTVIKENFCPSCGAKMDLEELK